MASLVKARQLRQTPGTQTRYQSLSIILVADPLQHGRVQVGSPHKRSGSFPLSLVDYRGNSAREGRASLRRPRSNDQSGRDRLFAPDR